MRACAGGPTAWDSSFHPESFEPPPDSSALPYDASLMRARHALACGLAALSLVAAGCTEEKAEESGSAGAPKESEPAPATSAEPREKPKVEVPPGPPPKEIEVKDLIDGDGAPAEPGQQLTVNYVGVSYSNGKEFDSSFEAGQPFPFRLGGGDVIPGWDQGLAGMKVGGRRQLTIPPELAYGKTGQPPVIKPNETLVFVIDLLGVK